MNCADIHPNLISYLDGELSSAQEEAVREHLAGCTNCQVELEARSHLHARLKAHLEARAMAVAAPEGAWQTLSARLGAPRKKTAIVWRIPIPVRLALAAAVVMLLVFSVPSVRAGMRTILGTILRYQSPDGQNTGIIGGFEAFVPYHAAYLPEGFQPSGVGSTTAPDYEAIELMYNHDENFILLVQSAGPGVGPLPAGAPLEVNANPAVYLSDFVTSMEALQAKMPSVATVTEFDYSHTHLLAWFQGEIKIEMLANISLEEMEKVAASLTPMQVEQGELPFEGDPTDFERGEDMLEVAPGSP